MSDPRVAEIAAAIVAIEALGPNVAWAFGTITNHHHVQHPFGRGVSVTINGATTAEPIEPVTIHEKGQSFAGATERAIARYRRRAAGEKWA